MFIYKYIRIYYKYNTLYIYIYISLFSKRGSSMPSIPNVQIPIPGHRAPAGKVLPLVPQASGQPEPSSVKFT